MRRITALLGAALLAVAPATALPSRSESKKQMEFGVEMALRGSWREAAFRFRKAVDSDPENPFALSNLGVALESVGAFDEALEAYGKALTLAPGNGRIEENLQRLQAYLATVADKGFEASDPADEEAETGKGSEPQAGGGDKGGGDGGS